MTMPNDALDGNAACPLCGRVPAWKCGTEFPPCTGTTGTAVMTSREAAAQRVIDAVVPWVGSDLEGMEPAQEVELRTMIAAAIYPKPAPEPAHAHFVEGGGKSGYALVMENFGLNLNRAGYGPDRDGNGTLWFDMDNVHHDTEEGRFIGSLSVGADDLVYLRDHLLLLLPLEFPKENRQEGVARVLAHNQQIIDEGRELVASIQAAADAVGAHTQFPWWAFRWGAVAGAGAILAGAGLVGALT